MYLFNRRILTLICVFSSILIVSGCSNKNEFSSKNIEHLSAGDATVFTTQKSAFSQKSANINTAAKILKFNLGNDFFEKPWVSQKASTRSRDGLGPHFNNNACQNCHVLDGRGHAPNVSLSEDGTDFSSLLIRAARKNISTEERLEMIQGRLANVADTSVGGQLQHRSNIGIKPEADLRVSYETKTVSFTDGYQVHLRKPLWHLKSLYADQGYDFNQDTVFSARTAQPMIGLGFLEAISEKDILKSQDIDDKNKDGISGRANYVWDLSAQKVRLGRFGWKAGQPSLKQQGAAAFVNDMGLTNEIFQQESCMPHHKDCLNAPNGNGDQNSEYAFEVPVKVMENISFYSHNLAVPARRNAYDKRVKNGKALFNQAGCQACHTPAYKTQKSSVNIEQSEQIIFPYTDMLLHDMGEELADFDIKNNPAASDVLVEFSASAREWRTQPLWGLGLTHVVDPRATFLHDGRARTIMEAVLWHGGEAKKSQQKVLQFNETQREDLILFLSDL